MRPVLLSVRSIIVAVFFIQSSLSNTSLSAFLISATLNTRKPVLRKTTCRRDFAPYCRSDYPACGASMRDLPSRCAILCCSPSSPVSHEAGKSFRTVSALSRSSRSSQNSSLKVTLSFHLPSNLRYPEQCYSVIIDSPSCFL